MKKKPIHGQKFWDGRPLYVFLFALYPVLFLYYQNIKEVAFGEMLLPAAVALALAAVFWLGLRPIVANGSKRALVAFLLLLIFFYYKPIRDALAETIGQAGMPFPSLMPALAIGCGAALALFWILRSKRSFNATGRILTAIMLALLAWNAVGIALFHARNREVKNARLFLREKETRPLAAPSVQPDIYCFFVDEFASLETISGIFHYDHSAFAERLRAAGFFIAEKSRSTSIWTPEAIASVLNMEKVPARTDPALLIKRNRVSRFLKQQGYKIIDFPYGDLTAQEGAQHFFFAQERASIFSNDFYRTLAEMTVLYPLVEKWQQDDDRYSQFFRRRVLYVFEQMPSIVRAVGPKFVLVHLFSPHAPFVFDRQGGAVPPQHATDYSERKYYLDQYLYISGRLAETAEMILKNSPRPPIIIIQSDHGYRGSFRKPLLHIVPEAEKTKIFLAMHLPGFPLAQLDPAMAPTQVFRLILNHYFAQDPAAALPREP